MIKANYFMLLIAIAIGIVFGSCKNEVEFIPQDQTQRYNLTISPVPKNGVITLSVSRALAGETVKVFVNPEPGYKLRENSVQYRFPSETNPTWHNTVKSGYYFYLNMQTKATEVTAVFDELSAADTGKYTVHIDKNLKNGKIISDITLGSANENIVLYVIPDAGYQLKQDSIVVKGTNGNQISGISVPSLPPHSFSLPAQNIIVSAVFEKAEFTGLLNNARSYLKEGQYDTAAGFYTEAYKKRGSATNQDDVNEVIFYYSFVKLGDILLTPNVRSLLGQGSLQMKLVPSTLDDWICDTAMGWPGADDNRWYATWKGIDYNNNNPTSKGYERGYDGEAVLWHQPADGIYPVTEDMVLPRLEDRFGYTGFAGTFADVPLIQGGNPSSPVKFANMMFWFLMAQNRSNGFNDMLQRIEERMFGLAFDEAVKVAQQMPSGYQNVTLYNNLINRFELDKYYNTSSVVKVGKAELDYIFGVLTAVKAAVQLLRAYNWEIHLQPYLVDVFYPEDGLDQIIDRIFKFAEDNETYKGYWNNSITVGRTLPFKNTFLNTRLQGNFAKSKSELSNALTMLNSSMTYWHGASSNFSSTAKTNYAWAKNAVSQAKNAIDNNSVNFDFPKKLPKPGGTWPSVNSGEYAVNLHAFFSAGAFNLQNIFTTETAGNSRAPSLFRIPWSKQDLIDEFDEPYQIVDIFPGKAVTTPVNASIPDDDRITIDGTRYYSLYSFEVNTSNLRTIFPRGFEQSKYTGRDAGKAYFYEVFPTLPLWPERPTYFLGPRLTNNKSAHYLYKYYH